MKAQRKTAEMNLGEYIARLRLAKGWSQRDLARRAGCSYAQIQKLENNDVASPGIQLIINLAKALNVSEASIILAYKGKDPDQYPAVDNDELEKAIELLERLRRHKGEH